MVKYLLVNAFIFLTFLTFAQTDNKDVVITSSGSGTTQELAKQTALRNAIEQAFGTFISSKTEILNDEIVADQMSSVSSGNIKSYEVLNESQLPNGTWASTLRVIVSVDKLTSFVEAKGITVEIKGGLFALNIKQQLLNEQGEINAIAEMVGVLHEPMQTAFDYTIKSGDPQSIDVESKNWEIPLTVTATANKNMDFCANYFKKTIIAISMSWQDVESYRALNKEVFSVELTYNNATVCFYLRKERSVLAIKSLITNWNFYINQYEVYPKMAFARLENQGNQFDFTLYNKGYCNGKRANLNIRFPNSGQLVRNFEWKDRRSLEQIEQMSGYTVKPRGVVSQFKHGGFVVYEENGHGLVAAITDLGKMDWASAKTACDELILNGYSDWHLPSLEEWELIHQFYQGKRDFGGLERGEWNIRYKKCYWSSTVFKPSSYDADVTKLDHHFQFDLDFEKTEQFGVENWYTNYVRAVRTF